MVTTVEELLDYHFSQRSLEEQLKIIAEGPPRQSKRNGAIKEVDLVELLRDCFIYKTEMWLCKSEEQRAFFCWTCLLFVKKETPWLMPCSLETKALKTNIRIHKKCAEHFHGMLQCIIFRSENNLSAAPKDVEKDEFYGKNREVLERIIDAVCVMVSQISPASVSTDYPDLIEQCVKLLHLIRTYNDVDVYNEARDFIQKNPRIVLDIMDSLATVIKKEIKKELKLSTFVSIILNGHSVVRHDLIFSTVVRYVNNGLVCERLIGFSSIDHVRTRISDFVQQLITDCEISEKFVGISSDGVVLPKERLNDFLDWMQKWNPKAFFVPCYFHEFNLVLQQTLSSAFPECDLFFRTLKSMKNYFGSRPECFRGILTFCSRTLLDFTTMKMTNSQFLRVLKMYRLEFIKFFAFVTTDSRNIEDYGFLVWLQDCQTVFLLELFFMLFAHTGFINEMLGSNSPDSAFHYYVIDSTVSTLRCFKQHRFVKVVARKNPDVQKSLKSNAVNTRLSELFEKILLHTIDTLELRFRKVISLGFLGILDFENRNISTVSNYYFKILSIMEFKFISVDQLVTELKVMGDNGCMSGRKSVYELLEFLYQKNLHKTFKNLSRLAEFIVCLPCKPLRSLSANTKLDSINPWTSCLQIPENMSLICVENDCLDHLKSLPNFYDQVISELKPLINKPK